MKKIAIIGAGISGLATAYYLKKANPEFEIRIFEATAKVGGIIQTHRSALALMECGPDAFISEKPWAAELCRELGLDSEIIPTQSDFRRSFIFTEGKLQPLPAGFYLTAPKNFKAWWSLPGLSFWGKLRMLGDFVIPAKTGDKDESVAEFVTRRFGRETLQKLAQPMIAGIYSANPESLSLLSTFPKLREMEKNYGSVMRALMASKMDSAASGARYSLFLSLKGGMGSLIRKLQSILAKEIHLAAPVRNIEVRETGWSIQTGWSSYEADVVCLAVPSYEAAGMLARVCSDISEKLKGIQFEPIATINYVFEKSAIRHPLDGFGFVVPETEESRLIGCSFSHQKFENRAFDSRHVLLRAFVGGKWGRSVLKKTDEEMTQKVLKDLNRILGVTAPPLETLVTRYLRGMPQYEVGHQEKMNDLFENVLSYPGLFLTGNSYFGIGLPDCIHQAKMTSEKIADFLASMKAKTAGYESQTTNH